VDYLERLVITGGGGELFKSCLGDEGNLDVGSSRKLNKRVAQAGMKTMQGAGLCFLSANHRLLIGGVQADGQDPKAKGPLQSTTAQLGGIHLKAHRLQAVAEPRC
tara:strand:+ start:442 stop:756 length:315 start_codon:yes stop_codon:yes gene_type:complete